MDVTATWPGSAQLRLMDITVRSAHHPSAVGAAGSAAKVAENRKISRYGGQVEPLAIEVGGRMAQFGMACLRQLAQEAWQHGRWRQSGRQQASAHVLRRAVGWERDRGMARTTLAALGRKVHKFSKAG